jgi:hypothetical protein
MTQDTPNTSTETAGAYLADGDGACWIYDDLKIIKNPDLPGASRPQGILIRRRPSHAGREKPWTPSPPLHRGTVTLWARTGSYWQARGMIWRYPVTFRRNSTHLGQPSSPLSLNPHNSICILIHFPTQLYSAYTICLIFARYSWCRTTLTVNCTTAVLNQ